MSKDASKADARPTGDGITEGDKWVYINITISTDAPGWVPRQERRLQVMVEPRDIGQPPMSVVERVLPGVREKHPRHALKIHPETLRVERG